MSDPDETNSSVSVDRYTRSTAPEFYDEIYAVPDELTEEFLTTLITDNTQYVESLPYGMGSYLSTDIIQYMFTICVRLRLPDDVKYLAMDIFDRYMNIQGQIMYDAVAVLNRSNSTKFKIWEKIETSLSRQLTLRICTAIQIASKIHSFHDSLALHNVRIMLQALGFPYTEKAIQKSELRMLKTLNFEMNSRRSPAVYVINFLKILIRQRQELEEDVEALYRYCIFWLDYTLINRDEIYRRILTIVYRGYPVQITLDKLARAQADYSLLGCAVIIAAIVCIKGPQFAEHYIEPLSIITTVTIEDISAASTGLVRSLLKDNSLEVSR